MEFIFEALVIMLKTKSCIVFSSGDLIYESVIRIFALSLSKAYSLISKLMAIKNHDLEECQMKLRLFYHFYEFF